MATFSYRAKENSGHTVQGVIEADSTEDAVEKINQLGYLPVRVEKAQAQTEQTQALPPTSPRRSFSGQIKSREITAFGRQLASLIRSGIPILRAIGIVAESSENSHFKGLLSQVHGEVKNGIAFSAALARYPKLFSPLYLALVQAGEISGTLDQTLDRITDHRHKQEEILSHVRAAMVYPILMAFTGIGTIIFMLTFVMPRLMGIFSRLGSDLPMPTQILIAISTAVREGWMAGPLLALVLVLVVWMGKKSRGQRIVWSRIRLRLPVFGPLTLKVEVARFSRTMALLLKSGIPILKTLESATSVLTNEVLKNELARCLRELKEGGMFGKSLGKTKIFPVSMGNLISVGEESGKLDETFSEIADFYERETDEAIRTMTALLEPVMILVMGLIVGFIVIAMLLPMFEMNLAVK